MFLGEGKKVTVKLPLNTNLESDQTKHTCFKVVVSIFVLFSKLGTSKKKRLQW